MHTDIFPPPTGLEQRDCDVQIRVFERDEDYRTERLMPIRARRCNNVWALTPWINPRGGEAHGFFAVTHLATGLKVNFLPVSLELAETIYLTVHHINAPATAKEAAQLLTTLGIRAWITEQISAEQV